MRNSISKFAFTFTNPEEQVRVLDGAEEGTFSWVTANFLKDAFSTVWYSWNTTIHERSFATNWLKYIHVLVMLCCIQSCRFASLGVYCVRDNIKYCSQQ